MLQQTQVDRVLPKYLEWLARFPTLEALAARPVEEAVETWYPLGYNVRPRRLHSIACESMARYGGELPSDEATLLSFQGIGPYTAGAIRSFAFGQRSAILDTNVARVLFRVFVGCGDARSHATRKHLWSLSRALLPYRRVFDFNQALMDFGATVCTARRPACEACPMRKGCAALTGDGVALQRPAASRRMSSASAGGNSSSVNSARETQRTSCPSNGRGGSWRAQRKNLRSIRRSS
jgi:A/G-specific adenine glycosylase